MGPKREHYATEIDPKRSDLDTIRNRNGMVVKATDWGAKVQQILVPDGLRGVALGCGSIAALMVGRASMGAFIGRYPNRIGQAKFSRDGQQYKLVANDGINSRHGGPLDARSGFCLQLQGFPDCANKPHIPSRVQRAGDWYIGGSLSKRSDARPTLPSAGRRALAWLRRHAP
jgi:galactose mutarotase-like enzyme